MIFEILELIKVSERHFIVIGIQLSFKNPREKLKQANHVNLRGVLRTLSNI